MSWGRPEISWFVHPTDPKALRSPVFNTHKWLIIGLGSKKPLSFKLKRFNVFEALCSVQCVSANFASSRHSLMTHWLPSQPSKNTTEMRKQRFTKDLLSILWNTHLFYFGSSAFGHFVCCSISLYIAFFFLYLFFFQHRLAPDVIIPHVFSSFRVGWTCRLSVSEWPPSTRCLWSGPSNSPEPTCKHCKTFGHKVTPI